MRTQQLSGSKAVRRNPSWRLMAVLVVLGLSGVISGLFTTPELIGFGALLLLIAPLGFLLAAPPIPEDRHDYVADAYMRIFPRRMPPR